MSRGVVLGLALVVLWGFAAPVGLAPAMACAVPGQCCDSCEAGQPGGGCSCWGWCVVGSRAVWQKKSTMDDFWNCFCNFGFVFFSPDSEEKQGACVLPSGAKLSRAWAQVLQEAAQKSSPGQPPAGA